MADEENRLLEKARAGNSDALGDLLIAHQQACYSLALRLTGRKADAEDVCQDAFSRAARDLAAWRPIGSFRSWLLSIVVCAHRNRYSSEVARQHRERSYGVIASCSVPSPASSGLEQQELRRQLDISLGKLEEDYRLPIVLHHEQGLTCVEAARVLGLPEGTVKTNIRRGLEELRGMMAAAGYACTVPAMASALAEGVAGVAVPAGLTAFIQGLTVAASKSAAAAGKAAAGAAIKISARFSAKKAVGLALFWKGAAVVVAAAVIAGAAVVMVKPGMFREEPTVPPAGPPTAAVQGRDLAGWWKFDEGAGDVVHDSSGNGNHGRIAMAQWEEGRFGKGLLLDNRSNVEVPWNKSLDAVGGVTIAAWVRIPVRPGPNDKGVFLRIGERAWGLTNYRLTLLREHTLQFSNGDERGRVGLAHADCGSWPEGWFHAALAVSTDGRGSYKAYLNGKMIPMVMSSPGVDLRAQTPGRPLEMRNMLSGFNCVIDEVRVYTRALSAKEILALAEEDAR